MKNIARDYEEYEDDYSYMKREKFNKGKHNWK